MRVGVISEGWADFAVLRSIVTGVLGLDAAEVDAIRPELQTDETSRHAPGARAFSNWELVKQDCVELTSIRTYLGNLVDGERLMIVHIDSAECDLPGYEVVRPDPASESYVGDLVRAVVGAIRGWTQGAHADRLVEAVAVEETDAWLIGLYASDPEVETGRLPNPKERLQRALQRTTAFREKDRTRLMRESNMLRKYAELSKALQKPKGLRAAMATNASLELFVHALGTTADRFEPGICRLPGPDEPAALV